MEFFAKKLISALLLPVPIIVLLFAIGVFLIWFIPRFQLASKYLSLAFFILVLFSFAAVPSWLLGQLESQYRPLISIPKDVQMIVVLGGGVRENTSDPPNTQLSSATLSRLIEAIRLYRQQPNRKIVLSGGRVFGANSESHTMNNLVVALGVPQEDIVIENGSRDTHQEALYLKSKLDGKPFILVTSAYHMPRAMALFKAQGLDPIAAPAQFLVKQNYYAPKYYLPNTTNLVYADIAIHEYLGLWWAKMRGEAG